MTSKVFARKTRVFFGSDVAMSQSMGRGQGMVTRFTTAVALTLAMFVWGGGLAEAGQRHAGGGGSAPVGHAVPRGSAGAPGHPGYPGGGHGGYYPYYGHYHPYYPYYYGYYGYPYGYYPYGWGFSIGFGFGYPYGYVGGYWGYPYGGYGYAYPYVSNYGGVKIQGAPKDAAVYADGYYVGTVEDFDGAFQQLNLESGAHHVEVMLPDRPPASVDVNIHPGQTVNFRVN
jgi:hypothetical protein